MSRGLSLSLARARRRRGVRPFDPTQVAAVAAGYFWDPAAVTGSGATFVAVEGNGKTAYNQITPAANTAPTLGTINAQPIMQFVNGSPDQLLRTSAKVTRGWTGATMIWGWVNCAAGPGLVLGHWRTANNMSISIGATRIDATCNDGTSREARFPLPAAGYASGPFYYEVIFDPSQSDTNRIQLTIDRVAQVPTLAPSMGSSLQDTAEYLTFGGAAADGTAFNYTQDFQVGVMGFCNGIPSDAERDALFNYRRLK